MSATKYKLTVTNYFAPLKSLIIILICCISFSAISYLIIQHYWPNKFAFNKFFIGGLIGFIILFLLDIKRMAKKEEIQITSEYINSLYFGKIFWKDISEYEIKNFKGNNLVIKINDGRRLSFGARNNVMRSARKEYENFVNAFEEKVKLVNPPPHLGFFLPK